MSPRLQLIVQVAFFGVFVSACSSTEDSNGFSAECQISNEVTDAAGKLHGEPCDSDDECMFGLCHLSPAVAPFKICTKRCDCGDNSACSNENGDGKFFVCQRYSLSGYPDEELLAICTRTCESSTAQQDCPQGYTGCNIVTGAQKICMAASQQ